MTSDPRLNSVHLRSPRREQFRVARDALFEACGPQTLAGASPPHPLQAGGPATAVQNVGKPAPSGFRFFLLDQDYIYPLKTGVNTVGRLPDNDVVIPDPYVSRRHCAILIHASEGCELQDVASKNGTLINGRPLQGRARLTSGDRISMCDRQLVFLAREDVPPDRELHTVQMG
jgi:pSer/pThr/pTyr-binding forkhead associated (FHA) protein